jgi:hypothetical protein
MLEVAQQVKHALEVVMHEHREDIAKRCVHSNQFRSERMDQLLGTAAMPTDTTTKCTTEHLNTLEYRNEDFDDVAFHPITLDGDARVTVRRPCERAEKGANFCVGEDLWVFAHG